MAKRFTVVLKSCSKCGKAKRPGEFYARSDKPHLLQSHCKQCVRARNSMTAKLSEKKKVRDRAYHLRNREKRLAYLKQYQSSNREKIAAFLREKYSSDSQFRIGMQLRNRTRIAIKRGGENTSVTSLVGCSISQLRKYIEQNFKPSMTWGNYGKWEIDHIIPIASFNLESTEDQARCFHFSNLQPLWKSENRKKSALLTGVGYR